MPRGFLTENIENFQKHFHVLTIVKLHFFISAQIEWLKYI